MRTNREFGESGVRYLCAVRNGGDCVAQTLPMLCLIVAINLKVTTLGRPAVLSRA